MPAERRAAPRRRVQQPTPLRLYSREGRLLGGAAADDVSAGGVSLLTAAAYPPGVVLLVEVDAPGRPGARFAFRVARCECVGGGHRVAGPFAEPLPHPACLALLDLHSATNRPAHPALAGPAREIGRPCGAPPSQP